MSATAACADLAPQGILRASINLGNPLLARRDATSGEVGGVSVDLARALAERLAVPLELVVFDTAGRSVEAVSETRADVGFFAIDPQRGQDIAFTAPYVLIEGCYLVRDASPLTHNEEVDRSGHRIARALLIGMAVVKLGWIVLRRKAAANKALLAGAGTAATVAVVAGIAGYVLTRETPEA